MNINVDKFIKIIVAVGIIVYLFIMILPSIIEGIDESKKILKDTKDEYDSTKIVEYIDSKPNYYFKYEGATYCIPVSMLINEGISLNTDIYKSGDIIEAIYSDSEYSISINRECEEK